MVLRAPCKEKSCVLIDLDQGGRRAVSRQGRPEAWPQQPEGCSTAARCQTLLSLPRPPCCFPYLPCACTTEGLARFWPGRSLMKNAGRFMPHMQESGIEIAGDKLPQSHGQCSTDRAFLQPRASSTTEQGFRGCGRSQLRLLMSRVSFSVSCFLRTGAFRW